MTRSKQWERMSEWPLIASSIAFLIAYAVPIIEPEISTELSRVCSGVVIGTWILFSADYVVRLSLAERRRDFVTKHLLDLVVIVLPLLRPLRLVRLVAVVKILNRSAARNLRGRVVLYVSSATVVLVFCAALAMTAEERFVPGANITGFGDGVWWAVTTITTVGYGDRYPVTVTGRLIAAGLMLGGIALVGVVTATPALDRSSQSPAQIDGLPWRT